MSVAIEPSPKPGIHLAAGTGDPRSRPLGPLAAAPGTRSSSVDTPGGPMRGVEHLLATCVGLERWAVRVRAPQNELPGLDGSAVQFVRPVAAKLFAHGSGGPAPRILAAVAIDCGSARIRYEPFPRDGLEIYYRVDFRDSGGSVEEFGLTIEPSAFLCEIAPARTFAVRGVDECPLPGVRGPHLWTDSPNSQRRFPDELVRHKILDLLGDLAFLGAPLRGTIVADRAGHALHRALVRRLGGSAHC